MNTADNENAAHLPRWCVRWSQPSQDSLSHMEDMKRRIEKMTVRVTLAILCFAAIAIETNTQNLQIRSDAQIVSMVSEYMANAVQFDHFSGAVLVARDGKPIISKGYGMANYELNVPNNPNTKFRIGSVSKQFTAASILQLQERKKLNIDDSIARISKVVRQPGSRLRLGIF